ncbi:LysR family transcriptional regulator [Diaphorobacter sp. HDW4B]|uniref:LysR family transcriptional regulator n=1 Tax=Diaphorobacter sp. HDW4B TaxID=2714925 RepID=UPI001409031F|nr:LysR family transcriptional regulator [Diaphorobacter sp. HDW4B]QIL69376.1 LysR family transcriptional regulator [Diaphorobacter sp. HDW4B]
MNVSPRHLRMFLTLASSLNFSKAAEQLFMTQPSLSKVIRDLEEALGLPLFERTTRHVRLTVGGAQLVAVARSVVGEYEAGLKRLQSSAEREARHLAVAAFPSLTSVLLPKVCAALEARHAASRITIIDCSNTTAVEHVLRYQVDFALASVAPSHPDLHYEEVVRDRFVLLAGRRWRRKLDSVVTLDEMLSLPLITMTDNSTAMRYISAAYLQRGVEFRPKMQFDQLGTVASFVEEGLGVAVLPYLAAAPLRRLHRVEIADGPLRSIGIVKRRLGNPTTMAVDAMDEVRKSLEDLILRNPEGLLTPTKSRW